MNHTLNIDTPGRGFTDITRRVESVVSDSGVRDGLCTVFVRHTSASLLIQENADPAVRADLESWMSRAVRDGDPAFLHHDEGPDDMPSHIRAALTAVSVAVPICEGRLALGRWQGMYLWELRTAPHSRQVVVHVGT